MTANQPTSLINCLPPQHWQVNRRHNQHCFHSIVVVAQTLLLPERGSISSFLNLFEGNNMLERSIKVENNYFLVCPYSLKTFLKLSLQLRYVGSLNKCVWGLLSSIFPFNADNEPLDTLYSVYWPWYLCQAGGETQIFIEVLPALLLCSQSVLYLSHKILWIITIIKRSCCGSWRWRTLLKKGNREQTQTLNFIQIHWNYFVAVIPPPPPRRHK